MYGFTVYRPDTGEIIASGQCSTVEDVTVQENAVEETAIVMDGMFKKEDYYVIEHEAVERPKLAEASVYDISADGVQTVTIHDIPVGTVVQYLLEEDTINDGEFAFVTSLTGRYLFHFIPPFPHRELFLEINANAV